MTTHTVETATAAEEGAVIAILTLAFSSDPATRWTWPAPKAYLEAFPRFAKAFIAANESGFRVVILSLGNALKLDAPDDLNAISAQLAGLAYAAYGIEVAPSVVAQALQAAMMVCSGDFAAEIMATIGYVQGQLAAHNIGY